MGTRAGGNVAVGLLLGIALAVGGCGDSGRITGDTSSGGAHGGGNGAVGANEAAGSGGGGGGGQRGGGGGSGQATLGYDTAQEKAAAAMSRLAPRVQEDINRHCDRMWGSDPHREVCVERHALSRTPPQPR